MTIEEYLKRVKAAQARHPEWRTGQTHVNVLFRVRPDVAQQLPRDLVVDPFYNDENVPAFVEWLRLRWVQAVKA